MTVHADLTNVAAAIQELSKFVLPIDVTKDLSRRNSSNFHTYSKTRVGRAVPRFQGILVVLMPLAQSEAMCRATPKPSTSPAEKTLGTQFARLLPVLPPSLHSQSQIDNMGQSG